MQVNAAEKSALRKSYVIISTSVNKKVNEIFTSEKL